MKMKHLFTKISLVLLCISLFAGMGVFTAYASTAHEESVASDFNSTSTELTNVSYQTLMGLNNIQWTDVMGAVASGTESVVAYILEPYHADGTQAANVTVTTRNYLSADMMLPYSGEYYVIVKGVTKNDVSGTPIIQKTSDIFTYTDEVAPIVGWVTDGTERTSVSEATVQFNWVDRLGTVKYYYAVVESGAAAPAIDTSGAGTAAVKGSENYISLTGLTSGAKDIYLVAKDQDGNESAPIMTTIPDMPHEHDFGTAHECECGVPGGHTFDATSDECSCGAIKVSEKTFPNAAFRSWVLDNITAQEEGYLSAGELAAVTEIMIDGWTMFENLIGIGYFTELTKLEAYEQELLSTLDLSQNTKLEIVIITNEIPESGLRSVSLPASVTYLNLRGHDLTSIDLSGLTELVHLNLNDHQLTSIDVSNNKKLEELHIGNNKLTSLDISQNTKLTVLNCGNNFLESLDVSKAPLLVTLYCDNNKLTSLDLTVNHALEDLMCYNNQLTSLKISDQAVMSRLHCYNNHLTSLDLSANDIISWTFRGEGQTASVTLQRNIFDMTEVDASFDGSRASSSMTGVSFSGNNLVLAQDMSQAVYSYDTGNSTFALEVTLDIQYADFSTQITELGEKLDKAVTDLSTAIEEKASAEDIQSAMDTLTAAYQEADKVLEDALQGQIDTNATAIADLQTAMTTANDALEAAISKVAADLETAKSDLQTQIDNLKSGHTTDMAALEKAISDLDQAYKAADATINSEIVKLQNEDASIKQGITDLQSALETAKTELKGLIENVQKTLDEAKADLEEAIATNKTDLIAELEALEGALKNADLVINKTIADLIAEDAAINASISALENSIANTKTELKNAIDAVTANLEAAKSELNAAITNGNAALEEKIAQLDRAYKAADTLIQGEITSFDAQIKESITALENSLAGVKSELEAAIAQVRKDLDDAKAELAQKDDELKLQLETQKDELNDKITVLIVVLSVVGVIAVGGVTVGVIALVKKRKG